MDRLSCAEARAFDMVDYLHLLGIVPQRVRCADYWYFSPLREEKTPSFKVNSLKNIWYDHGLGKGGNLLDFGVLFHQCSLSEFLYKLSQQKSPNFSFHQPFIDTIISKKENENKLQILSVSNLFGGALIDYANERGISFQLAKKYLKEVHFKVGAKSYQALGFENMKGGYELRSKNFKGSSSPKDITLMENGGNTTAIFEGFFSFLSYLTMKINGDKNFCQTEENETNYLILNSLSFLDKKIKTFEKYRSIQLYLDNDIAGRTATQKLFQYSIKCEDKSSLYHGHKDLNDYLVYQNRNKQKLEQALPKKQRMSRGRRI